MATRQAFCLALNTVWQNHGMYVGTANGERTLDIAGKFFEMEKNYGRRDKEGNPLWYVDAARDYEYLAKCYRKKWDMTKSRVGDCSGIIVGVMRDLGIIKPTADYSVKMFQKKAKAIPLTNLQPADLVFNKTSDASHVGTYVGDGMVIESKGRDEGVVKRKVSEGNWVVGGRLDWFDDEVTVLTRVLKYVPDNLMRGDDVKAVQTELNKRKFNCGTPDGAFGKNTESAVKKFQESKKLTADGKVGKDTALALGFAWEG